MARGTLLHAYEKLFAQTKP